MVTGGSNGIGRGVSERLAKNGINVIVIDKEKPNADFVDFSYQIDVVDSVQVEKIFDEIHKKFGRIDILVNAIGGTLHSKKVEDISNHDWERTYDLNVKTAFYCTRAVVPYMKLNNWGRIVNISAVAGETATFFGGVDFTAAKSAIIGMTRQCAVELAPFGITANAVAPGLTFTERVKELWEEYSPEKKEKITSEIGVGRASTVDEQVNAICFLCSEESSYICGSVLDNNGALFIR